MKRICEGCSGGQREACDAVYDSLRNAAAEKLPTIIEMAANDDLVGVLSQREENVATGIEHRNKLRSVGCTLPDDTISLAFLDEVISGLELAAYGMDEQEEQEELERLASVTQRALDEVRDVRSSLKVIANEIAADKKIDTDEATNRYCAANGWDRDNLEFYQQLDLKGHLRSLGLS